jgi:hypothetical protein
MKNYNIRLISFLVLIPLLSNLYTPAVKAYPELSLSQEYLNFGRQTKLDVPILKFTIKNIHNNPTKVTLTPSQSWIHLSPTSFDAAFQEIEVKIDTTSLTYDPGLFLENIKIESDVFSFTLPIRLDLVEKKVTILFTIDNPVSLVDGKEVKMEFPPFIYKGKTMVPIGIICESFGATTTYKNEDKSISIKYKDINAVIFTWQTKMILNGKEYKIFEPTIRCGRIFVQLKLIYEIFGARLTYIYHTRSIKIEY